MTVAAVVIFVYVDHIGARRRYITEQRANVLARLTSQLTDSITAIRTAVENAAQDACQRDDTEPGNCRWLEGNAGGADAQLPPAMECVGDEQLAAIARRSPGQLHATFDEKGTSLSFAYQCPDKELPGPVREAVAHAASAPSGPSSRARPRHRGVPTAPTSAQVVRVVPARPLLQARLNVGRALVTLLQTEGVSENLLLARPDGAVIWRVFPTLDPTTNLLDLYEDAAPNAAQRRERPKQLVAGRVERLSYLGEPHDLFVSPIELTVDDVPNTAPTIRFMLCDMVSDAQTRHDARAVAPIWLLGLTLAVGLTLLAWPLLKLRYMGPRERLTIDDVWILVLCGTLAAGVVTAAVLVTRLHIENTLRRDTQLKDLAHEGGIRLRRELLEAWTMLQTVAVEGGRPSSTYHDYVDLLVAENDGYSTLRWIPVSRLDGGVAVWGSEPFTPPTLSIKDRGYFVDVERRRYWSLGLQSSVAGEPQGFAVQPVQSRLTANLLVVLATHVRHERRTRYGLGNPQVALITIRPAALTNPIIPPGLGLMAVDAEGTVQLHSITSRSMRENLLVECERDPHLASALRARRAQHLDATCYGSRRRLYVTPMADTPWSIVTVGDPARLQTIDVEVIATWIAMFGVYFFFLVAAVVCAQLARRGYRTGWLWPSRGLGESYAFAAVRLLITAAVLGWLAFRLGGVERAVVIALVPTVSIAGLCLTLGTPITSTERALAIVFAAVGGMALAAIVFSAGDWRAVFVLAASGLLWSADVVARSMGRRVPAPAVGLGAAATIAVAVIGERVPWLGMLLVAAVPPMSGASTMRGWLSGSEHGFRTAYTSMLVSLLVLVAIVPAAIVFDDAAEYVELAYAKHGQLELARALIGRAQLIQSQAPDVHADPALVDAVRTERLLSTDDVYAGAWLRWPAPLGSHAESSRRPVACEVDGSRCPSRGATSDLMSLMVASWLPAYDALSPDLRRAACDGATDGGWCWRRTSPDGPIELRIHDRRARALLGAEGRHTFRSEPPVDDTTHVVVVVGTLAFGTALFGFFAVVLGSIARRVFVLDADATHGTESTNVEQRPRRKVLVFTSGAAGVVQPAPGVAVIDLTAAPDAASIAALGLQATVMTTVEIDHVESVLLDADRLTALATLVRTMLARNQHVVLTSEVDPFETPPLTGTNPARASDWSALSAGFVRRLVALGGEPGTEGAILGARYYDHSYEPTLSDDLNDDRLQTRNNHLWTHCTQEERLVLRQLADEGFLNPNNEVVERGLFRRGLIRRTPAFELLDSSFHRYVRRTTPPSDVTSWEQQGAPSAWARLRPPLMGLGALACGFFFVTQRDAFDSAVGIITAVVGSLPLLVRMATLVGTGKTDGAAAEKT